MATIDDLEAALRADLDRATVEVYGDQLQADGDIRGELIAIDLRIADAGATPPLLARRDELVREWLGSTLPHGRVRFGFVDLDATGADLAAQLRVAFEGSAAAYVRTVAIVGPPKQITGAIAMIAAQPRPRLVNLVVRQWAELETPAIQGREAGALVRATPHLRTLVLDGRNLFAELPHPGVRELRVSGYDAIASAITDGLTLAGLVELDFAFHCHLAARKPSPPEQLGHLLRPELVPALVHLDLSRNEPGYLDPDTLGGTVNIPAFLRDLAIRPQLESLYLPSISTDADVKKINAALVDMPKLRELTVTRSPAGAELVRKLAHPTATIDLD
ncbi:MAG: hypothetical protein ABI867_32435 [Kofleriaceae bacterium]